MITVIITVIFIILINLPLFFQKSIQYPTTFICEKCDLEVFAKAKGEFSTYSHKCSFTEKVDGRFYCNLCTCYMKQPEEKE